MEQDSEELFYSEEALANRPRLYDGMNDLVLLVEDADKQYEYEAIFKRLLGEKYCITTIFPLGGKEGVKHYFQENGETTNGKKNFYLVDGDFDRYIKADTMINSPCFLYLKAYNIENYFIDEEACVYYAQGIAQQVEEDVRRTINFPRWRQQIVEQAKKLFLCYCFIQKYYPSEPNVSRKHAEFLDYDTGFERDDQSFQEYWKHILELDELAQNKIDEIASIYQAENGEDYYNLICGKFLMTSLHCYLKSILKNKKKGNWIDSEFRWHLLNNFDISKLDYVKVAINDVMG